MSTIVAPHGDVSTATPEVPKTRNNRLSLGLIGAPIALLLALAWMRRWVADDAFINYRIVDNFLNGDGLVFNAGERIEAGTSTLWLLLLAFFELLPTPFSMEWWSVLLGMGLTALGLALGAAAALQLSERPKTGNIVLPVGIVVLAVLPPMWDYVTSGLENGLSYAWLGGSFYMLADAQRSATTRRSLFAALIISLGVLVRPDLGIFWAGFGAALVLCVWTQGRRSVIRTIVGLIAIPVAFEIYRLGYFAALAPNTAIAKEASMLRPDQGFAYLYDLVRPYLLVIPALLTAVLAALAAPRGDRLRLAVWAAPILCGLAHVGYVILIGGDYMHGRMLLPSIFGILLPVMAVRVTLRTAGLVGLVWIWAATCLVFFRADYQHNTGASFIGDERRFYIGRAAVNNPDPPAHPVTLEDYGTVPFTKFGLEDKALAARQPGLYKDLVVDQYYENERPLGPDVHAPMVVTTGNIGMYGYAVGTKVRVVDTAGLGDPLASRVELLQRAKPGHEKRLPTVWIQARYAPSPTPDTQEQAARHAMSCGDVAKVLKATNDPLTPQLFISNVVHAPHYWKVRIPSDPEAAEAKFCK